MKAIHILFLILLTSPFCLAQNVDFSLVQQTQSKYEVRAHCDCGALEDFNITDMGITLRVPAGVELNWSTPDLADQNWSMQRLGDQELSTNVEIDASASNLILVNLLPGKKLEAIFKPQGMALFSFEVTNLPENGFIHIVDNESDLAKDLHGIVDNFFNAELKGGAVKNYYAGMSAAAITDGDIEFTLYPNPASDIIYLSGDIDNLDRIEVFSISGQLVKTLSSNMASINLSGLQDGVYLFKMYHTFNGESSKIIIKN